MKAGTGSLLSHFRPHLLPIRAGSAIARPPGDDAGRRFHLSLWVRQAVPGRNRTHRDAHRPELTVRHGEEQSCRACPTVQVARSEQPAGERIADAFPVCGRWSGSACGLPVEAAAEGE